MPLEMFPTIFCLSSLLILLNRCESNQLPSFVSAKYKSAVLSEWNEWKLKYDKKYSNSSEERFRFNVFVDNKMKISKHNEAELMGLKTFRMKLNQFADLLNSEFSELINRLKMDSIDQQARIDGSTFLPVNGLVLPPEVDWRKKGFVTEVKNQGLCGSCWAFSATGALEGQNFRKTKKLVSLSEQNLLDCSWDEGNEGCNGGWMNYAFEYVKRRGGIDSEKSYPYSAVDQFCNFNKSLAGECTGFVSIKSGSEIDLAEAVATVGPVSVAIDASSDKFRFYSSGVYDDVDCSSTLLNHGVLVVGYGINPNGKEFWIVKNSWGTSWGVDGYILMSRNKHNQCGIANYASYPLV